ncbi:hypothetical protein PENTCL1PPCAC_3663, partial [Pristionchus entomophagus]
WSIMEPDMKDRDAMYRLIIRQLYHDGYKQLALDLSHSIDMIPSLPLRSNKLFRLVSAARLVAESDDEDEEEIYMQMSLSQVTPPIDNLTINEECSDMSLNPIVISIDNITINEECSDVSSEESADHSSYTNPFEHNPLRGRRGGMRSGGRGGGFGGDEREGHQTKFQYRGHDERAMGSKFPRGAHNYQNY